MGHKLTLPQPPSGVKSGQDVHVMVRPEGIEMNAADGLPGVVRQVAYLGSVIDYDVELGGKLIAVLVYDPRRKALHNEGDTVRLGIIPEATYLLPK